MLGRDANEDACADEMAGTTEAKLGPPKVPWMEWIRWAGTTAICGCGECVSMGGLEFGK